MKNKLIRFCVYGFAGWCLEIFFTGLKQGLRGNKSLTGKSYLWMFPIYGLSAFLLEPIHDRIRRWPWPARAATYSAGIMTVEYATGWMLDKSIGECPWDYSGRSLVDINGYVRLEYAPMWAAVGLGAERIHDFLTEAIPAVEDALASRER
ncbi:MAG: hypothetical protein DCC49_13315 [Acidobacteria bacterium]|nr:MAG: hypothetical protein DCC49_13315 [Acidobacteriota bacterium]